MCQDWINENGLFVWICSEVCKHLTIEFQEQDLRLGTKPGDLMRKWLEITAQASRKVHPCVQHCWLSVAGTRFVFDKQLTGPRIHVACEFWPVGHIGAPTNWLVPGRSPGFWGHVRSSDTKDKLRKLRLLNLSREASRGLLYVSSNIWRTIKWKRNWILILLFQN